MSADDTWGFDIRGPDRPQEIPYYQVRLYRPSLPCFVFKLTYDSTYLNVVSATSLPWSLHAALS